MAAITKNPPPKHTKQNLNIFQWNANGILPRLPDLKNYIARQQIQPDIICIQESHLTDKKNLKIPSYITERRDRKDGKSYGGVATLIKTNIVYTVLENIPDIEELTIKIKLCNQDIIITNIYNPPGHHIEEKSYSQLANRPNVVILGDLNAHLPLFGGRKTDSGGISIEKLIDTYDLIVLNDRSGTRINNDGTLSSIDVTLASKNLGLKTNWHVHTESLGSDHLPILIEINEKPVTQAITFTRYQYRRADWSTFKTECGKSFQEPIFDQDNAVYNNNIVAAIHKAAEKSVPKTRNNNLRAKNTPYWNKRCNDAVKNRQKAERKMRKSRELIDCITYRQKKKLKHKKLLEKNRLCAGKTTATN